MQISAMPSLLAPNARKWNAISMLFSLFYFLPVIMSAKHFDTLQWIAVLASYAVFVGLYLWGLKTESQQILFPVAALIACCIGASMVTPGSNALFGFAMFLSAYHRPFKQALWILLITVLIEVLVFTLVFNYNLMFLGIAVFLSIALFANGSFVRKDVLHRMSEERDQDQIQQLATIAERERISRDLHDLLGHSLSSIALKAELAEKLLKAGQQDNAAKEIAAVAQLSRAALSEVRESVSGLKKTGIAGEFKLMCERIKSAGFRVSCDNQLSPQDKLSADIESAYILLLKEASTNIIRHSQGDQASLSLAVHDNSLSMRIWDDGIDAPIAPGNGLQGMQSRCQQIAADFQINAGPEGTLITITKELNDD